MMGSRCGHSLTKKRKSKTIVTIVIDTHVSFNVIHINLLGHFVKFMIIYYVSRLFDIFFTVARRANHSKAIKSSLREKYSKRLFKVTINLIIQTRFKSDPDQFPSEVLTAAYYKLQCKYSITRIIYFCQIRNLNRFGQRLVRLTFV